jgi:N-acetyl-gamma-glutamyl-phosphate reductase
MSMRKRIAAAVVNGTGYGGVELLRLLRHHPEFALVEVTARSEAGKPLAAVFPQLAGMELTLTPTVERAEVVFVALPDHAAIELIPALLAAGRRVVDLSAGFRLRAPALYPRWYGYEHGASALLEMAVYGLAEWAREALPAARLVACPGCYPTAALLALGPALAGRLIGPDIVVDAKSGLSGAGRALKLSSHYSEANEDVSAYGLDGHRHWPEIAQELRRRMGDVEKLEGVGGVGGVGDGTAEAASAAGSADRLRLTFIPHLVPMTRGILATCYADLRPGVTLVDVRSAYRDAYEGEPFVRLSAQPPHTKWTYGSNLCFVYPTVDPQSGRLIIVSALDNLMKGAAGQAVQCANLMYGLCETAGLQREGVWP